MKLSSQLLILLRVSELRMIPMDPLPHLLVLLHQIKETRGTARGKVDEDESRIAFEAEVDVEGLRIDEGHPDALVEQTLTLIVVEHGWTAWVGEWFTDHPFLLLSVGHLQVSNVGVGESPSAPVLLRHTGISNLNGQAGEQQRWLLAAPLRLDSHDTRSRGMDEEEEDEEVGVRHFRF